MKNRKYALILFILPSLFGVLIFYCIPFLLSFYYTLINNMSEKKFIGLGNFVDTLLNPMFQRGLQNQIFFIAIAVPICLVLALLLSFLLIKLKKGKGVMLLITLIPFVIPSGTIVYFWKCIFGVNGFLNKILYVFNIPMVNWYNGRWVMLIAIIIFVWKNIGIVAAFLYTGINRIPKEYYEIADIEGMGSFQIFYKITLVYLLSTIFICLLILVINSFKIFKEIYLLFGNYPNENIYLLQHYINNQFFSLNLPKLTTSSYILFFIVGFFIFVMFHLQKRYSDCYNSINFDDNYSKVIDKKSYLLSNSFATVIALILLIPIMFIISNSFMSSFEIVNRYTTEITENNISDIAVNGMHFVRMGILPDNQTISEYFKLLFRSPNYLRLYWNSIIIVVPILIGQCIISPLAAYAFEQSKSKFKEILFFVYILIMLMPTQVLLVPNYLVADWFGFLDTYLAIILPAIFNPIGVFVIRLQLKGFPKECIESAQNSGATHFQTFRYIVLPNIKASITILMVLIFTEYWNIIDQAIVFIKKPFLQPLSIYLSQIANGDLGLFFSTSCFYLIPVFIVFLIGSKYLSSDTKI